MKRKYHLAENALKKAIRINEAISDARKRVYDKVVASVPHLLRPVQGNRPVDIAEVLESDPELVELMHIQKAIFTDFTFSGIPVRVQETIFSLYFLGDSMLDIQKKHGVSARTVRRWKQQGLEKITELLKQGGGKEMDEKNGDFKERMDRIRQKFLDSGVDEKTTKIIIGYMEDSEKKAL